MYSRIDTLPLIRRTELKRWGSLTQARGQELLVVRGAFGAWKLNGAMHTGTLRRRGPTGDAPDNVAEKCPSSSLVCTIDEEVVWGGAVVRHYGHFLIESVARLWPLLPSGAFEGRRVVFSNQSKVDFSQEWLRAFGVQVVDLPRQGATRFKSVVVPEPAISIGAWISPEMRDIHLHARHNLPVKDVGKGGVVWLSRAGLEPDRTACDEKLLEWILRDHLTVLRPEKMKLSEQIAAIEGSHGVAGISGSAFHTLLMVRNPPPYLILCGQKVHTTYVMQDELFGRKGQFRRALTEVEIGQREVTRFPAGMRILIPETIRALHETVLPELADDERLAMFFKPDRPSLTAYRTTDEDAVMAAVARMLREPGSSAARIALGRVCEEYGLNDLAREQYMCVSKLG